MLGGLSRLDAQPLARHAASRGRIFYDALENPITMGITSLFFAHGKQAMKVLKRKKTLILLTFALNIFAHGAQAYDLIELFQATKNMPRPASGAGIAQAQQPMQGLRKNVTPQ